MSECLNPIFQTDFGECLHLQNIQVSMKTKFGLFRSRLSTSDLCDFLLKAGASSAAVVERSIVLRLTCPLLNLRLGLACGEASHHSGLIDTEVVTDPG